MAAVAITADAPEDLRPPDWLGVPLDENFVPLVNSVGSLFPQAGQPLLQPRGVFYSERKVVTDVKELKANAHAWKIPIGVSGGYASSKTYAFYRAVEIASVVQLNDATPMVQPPPEGARYYAEQIFYGYSFWVLVEGEARSLDGAIGLTVGQYGAVSAKGLLARSDLHVTMGGNGFKPNKEDALLAPPEQVSASFHHEGGPYPILVLYREIPSKDRPVRRIGVDFRGLQIGRTGAALAWLGHDTYWSMKADCSLNGMPQPTVTLLNNTEVHSGLNSVAPPTLNIGATDQDVLECVVSGMCVPETLRLVFRKLCGLQERLELRVVARPRAGAWS